MSATMRLLAFGLSLSRLMPAGAVPSFVHGNETTLHSFACTTACCEKFATCRGPGTPAQLSQCLSAMPTDCYVSVNATYIFRHTNELCIGRDSVAVDLSFLQKGPARMISDLIIWHMTFAANYHYPETHYLGWVVTDTVRRRLEQGGPMGSLRAPQASPADLADAGSSVKELLGSPMSAKRRDIVGNNSLLGGVRTEDHAEPWDPAGYLPMMEKDSPYELTADCYMPPFDTKNGVPAMEYYKAQGIPFTYHNGPMLDQFGHPDYKHHTPWLVIDCNVKGQWPLAEDYHHVWTRALVYHTDMYNAGCVAIPKKGTPRPLVLRSLKAEWPFADDRAGYSHSPVSTLIASQYDPIDTNNPVIFIRLDSKPELQMHLLWWETTAPYINATIESSFFGLSTPTA